MVRGFRVICLKCSKSIAEPIDLLPKFTNYTTCSYCYSRTNCFQDRHFLFKKNLMTANQKLTLAGFDKFKRNGKTWISINGVAKIRPARPCDIEEFVLNSFNIVL